MADLCDEHDDNTLLVVSRELTEAGVKETFRIIDPEEAGLINLLFMEASMNDIWYGILQAFQLIYTLDQDLIEISVRSLQVTLSALLISSLFALPLAAVLAVKRFKFRRL